MADPIDTTIKAEWTNADALDLQTTCNQLATDTNYLIYKEDAIDAIERTDWYHQNKSKNMVHGANSAEHQAWYKADDVYKALENVPSAQQTTCKYWDTESDFCTLYRPSTQPEIFSTPSYSVSTGEPVEYVQIIRCKDCKHGMYDVMCKFYWCHGVAHSANWFCADGKRRE